jgi:hypothetical protein
MSGVTVAERELKPAEDVVARRVGNEVVLVNLRTNRIFSLNRTGARLWELLEQGLTREAIAEQLTKEFDADPARVAAETREILSALAAERLVAPRAG